MFPNFVEMPENSTLSKSLDSYAEKRRRTDNPRYAQTTTEEDTATTASQRVNSSFKEPSGTSTPKSSRNQPERSGIIVGAKNMSAAKAGLCQIFAKVPPKPVVIGIRRKEKEKELENDFSSESSEGEDQSQAPSADNSLQRLASEASTTTPAIPDDLVGILSKEKQDLKIVKLP